MIENKTSIYDQPLEDIQQEILDSIFVSGHLSKNEKLILTNFIRLIRLYKRKDYWIHMQIIDLMESCDLSRSEVIQALSNLVLNGFLAIKNVDEDNNYVGNRYKFTDKIINQEWTGFLLEYHYKREILNQEAQYEIEEELE